MEYIGKTTDETAGNTDSGRIRRIHERVKKIRKSEKAGMRLMQKWEELAYERAEGKAEGEAKGIIEMSLKFGLSEEKILMELQKNLKISPEKAREYLDCYAGRN